MVDFSNLRLTDVFTRTGQPLSEAIGTRPDVTLAEISRPDLNFADIARPFVPGNIDFIRPGVFNPGDVGPIDIGPIRPPRDPAPPTISWPGVGIPADVRPGDLIQAAAWNALLAWVRALAAGATQAVPIQPPVVVPPVAAPPVAAPPVAAPPSATTQPPITFDPGRIPELQPIPRPPIIPLPPIEIPIQPDDITPFERLLLHPETRRAILNDPTTVERLATLPALGEALAAHPEILAGMASAAVPSIPAAEQPAAAPPIAAAPDAASIATMPSRDITAQPTLDAATVVERLSVDPVMGRVLEQPALRVALGITAPDAVDATRVADQPVAPATTTRTRTRISRTAGPG